MLPLLQIVLQLNNLLVPSQHHHLLQVKAMGRTETTEMERVVARAMVITVVTVEAIMVATKNQVLQLLLRLLLRLLLAVAHSDHGLLVVGAIIGDLEAQKQPMAEVTRREKYAVFAS
jgi:hypothetical protein